MRVSRALLFMLIAFGSIVTHASAGRIKHVIVIAMENSDSTDIYGNTSNAPYINQVLLPAAARATNYVDSLALDINSEPHYVIMEAGRADFADHSFTNDSDPSAENSTASHAHLTRQIQASKLRWMSYQESMNNSTGACPVVSVYPYAAKHNPFVFFQDIAGFPPNKQSTVCVAHHKPYGQFAADLAANRLADYVFITPNLCHDMHDSCGSANRFRAGDSWLARELPRMLTWADAHAGVIFIVWDESNRTTKQPFIAVGPGVKRGFVSGARFSHLSLLKSVETILGLNVLRAAQTANSLEPLFKAGAFP